MDFRAIKLTLRYLGATILLIVFIGLYSYWLDNIWLPRQLEDPIIQQMMEENFRKNTTGFYSAK